VYTFSKNDVNSSVRKRYCALELRLGRFGQMCFGFSQRRYVLNQTYFSAKCSRFLYFSYYL